MLRFLVGIVLFSMCVAGPLKIEFEEHWNKFKDTFNKTYSPTEEVERKKIFKDHVTKILHHNLQADLGGHSYRVGLNQYADMSPKEFVQTMNGYRKANSTGTSTTVFKPTSNLTLPESVDWRNAGLVTGVKDQQQCGSCWAFSATGALEGQNMQKTGYLISLSEQNLVDCSSAEGNYGCSGGWPDGAFQYVIDNNGIDTEDSYPYTAQNGACSYTEQNKGGTCVGYVDIPSGDEISLQNAVAAIGPISVCIDASNWSFQLYKNGVYNEPACSTYSLDHAVLAVGYGSGNEGDYWMVKNSWGTSWGEDGYIKMSRNNNNQCGIATEASYPVV